MNRKRFKKLKPEDFQDVLDAIDINGSDIEEENEVEEQILEKNHTFPDMPDNMPDLSEEIPDVLPDLFPSPASPSTYTSFVVDPQEGLANASSTSAAGSSHTPRSTRSITPNSRQATVLPSQSPLSAPTQVAYTKWNTAVLPDKSKLKFKRMDFEKISIPCDMEEDRDQPDWGEMSPYSIFKHFIPDEAISKIVEESKRYAMQKDGKSLVLDNGEVEQFFGVLLTMAIVDMPNMRMYWSEDYRCSQICDVMTRNRYQELMKYIHFNDNAKIKSPGSKGFDKCHKVRPLLDCVRDKLRKLQNKEHNAVNEQIIPFKGKLNIKQYIKNKPHKWGVKVFTRADSNGVMHDFEVYVGGETCPDYGIGFSGNIVLHLCKDLPQNKNYKVYTDNFFTSIALAVTLRNSGILFLGTTRKWRMGGAETKFLPDKKLQGRGRGSDDHLTEMKTGVTLVKWQDKKPITFLSTYVSVEPRDNCLRFNKQEKRKTAVSRPAAVKEYNAFMGGVDKADMLIECYRIDRKSYKWYFRIIFWLIGVTISNGWLLKRDFDRKMKLLDFHKAVTQGLLNANKCLVKIGRPLAGSPRNVPPKLKAKRRLMPVEDSRFDKLNHMPSCTTKGKCALCKTGFSRVLCMKCNVRLCLTPKRNCFSDFH